jgi:hypothetical protein
MNGFHHCSSTSTLPNDSGFPELALSTDDPMRKGCYVKRGRQSNQRDVLTLFNVRNPLSMEKLFLYFACILPTSSQAVGGHALGEYRRHNDRGLYPFWRCPPDIR